MDVGSSVTIGSAVVGALVAIFGVMGYQNRRVRLSNIRAAFNDVVGALASDDLERQLAGAILLRRFFDPASELSVRDLLGRRRSPYSSEALSVMAAVLRGLPTGDLQKLLADGLAYAPTLLGADLQRTNLQGAYLSPRNSGTLEGADFYRANISGGSLKFASAAKAVFYQARLRETVFRDADLRGANFFDADLTDAVFTGSRLEGANFARARNVPPELTPYLGVQGKYESTAPAPSPEHDAKDRRAVFLSLPSLRTPSQQVLCDRLITLLGRNGLETERLLQNAYPPSDALSEILTRLTRCVGVVVFGLRPAATQPLLSSVGATPWTHLEAGMAYGCNIPLLIVREAGVDSGTFDHVVAGERAYMLDLTERWDDDAVIDAMAPWIADLRTR